ncbi:MAG TPA: nuclear transport factor 2 family protein [Solirubrobacterales bacterium]
MSDIDTVKALNSIFDRYDFGALRDAVEGSDPEEVSSGIAELDALVSESLSDDVVIEFHVGVDLPEGARYEGREEYLRFWRGWLAAFEIYEIEHRDYEQVGDCVVVGVTHRGRGRGSGLEFELVQGQRWVLHDGRVTEIHVYDTHEEALADLPAE